MYTLLSTVWLVGLCVVPGISQVSIVRRINISSVIKFSLTTGMGMNNPGTGLTVK